MRTVVGVLRGGKSSEYDNSLKSGAAVLMHLNKDKYEPRDIFIDRMGVWHMHGVPVSPEQALSGADVAFNALHGEYGEDGIVARLLHDLDVPYTGSDPIASALSYNKHLSKEAARKVGIKTPHSLVVDMQKNTPFVAAQHLFRTFPHPAVIKPVAGTSSQGIVVADSYHALERALTGVDRVMLEEHIKGQDATVGIIDGFRGENTYALIPHPNIFSREEKEVVISLAKQMHVHSGARHYSTVDFIVGKRGVHFIEINTHPKLHEGGVFYQALQSVGAKLSDFFDHIISLARR